MHPGPRAWSRHFWLAPPFWPHWLSGAPSPFEPPGISRASAQSVVVIVYVLDGFSVICVDAWLTAGAERAAAATRAAAAKLRAEKVFMVRSLRVSHPRAHRAVGYSYMASM